jgi:uncharacterized protein (DUF433 family)
MFDRITFDKNIMGGRACIRGMRITVSVIVGQIAHGASFDEILEGYPDLEREDIQQALEYAAWLAREEVHPIEVQEKNGKGFGKEEPSLDNLNLKAEKPL